MRYAGEPLEDDFVVATWDQRGTGRSVDTLEPTSTLTLDQMVADTIEVTEYLCDRFDEQDVYLVGSSWGTTLGRPGRPAAPGPLPRLRRHRADGRPAGHRQAHVRRLARLRRTQSATGRSPSGCGRSVSRRTTDTFAYTQALAANPEWLDYPRGEDYDPRSEYPASLFVGEFTLTQQFRAAAGIFETFAVLYPQLQDIDFRESVRGWRSRST